MDSKLLVVVPMYNSASFIDATLNSILSQEVPVKVIVINDASTDNSAKKVLNFSQVELINNRVNRGTYYSINVGLRQAADDSSWKYYCIHGADDISLAGRFKKQLSALNTKKVLANGCGFSRVNYQTKKIVSSTTKTNESMLIFCREVFNKLGYYDTCRAGSDTEYKKRLLTFSPTSIYSLDEVLVHAYLHSNNLTKKIPLGGEFRRKYVAEFTRRHQKMKKEKNFYQDFKP